MRLTLHLGVGFASCRRPAGRRFATPGARLATAAVLIAVFAGCATHRAREPIAFRAMTYNIHHGEGVDGRVDLDRLAAVILEQRVDLVALQEVDKGVQRTAGLDFPAELAALTGAD